MAAQPLIRRVSRVAANSAIVAPPMPPPAPIPRLLRPVAGAVGALLVLVVAGCSTTPRSDRDGPGLNPPADLERLPGALPRVEPIRIGGPNKPYEVGGEQYTPLTTDSPLAEKGLASWYGRKFHGRRTASGEVYNMYAMTAAHKTMPIPSFARVRNPANGREVIVRINDRGPFVRGRIIDLSYAAATRLGVEGGVKPVEVERLTHDAIRAGMWIKPSGTPGEALPGQDDLVAPPQPSSSSPSQPPSQPQQTVVESVVLAAVPAPVAEQAAPATAYTPAAQGFWVQLGAYTQREGASAFQRQVAQEFEWLAPMLAVFEDRSLHRLQAGPYATRDQAREAAERIRSALRLVPVIVERR
jgi:rare lipoprotein A